MRDYSLSRFKMRCRRGMKELDFVLDRYLERHFARADHEEIRLLDELLELQDPLLFGVLFATDVDPVPDKFIALAEKIRQA